jgi:hypothetical protein
MFHYLKGKLEENQLEETDSMDRRKKDEEFSYFDGWNNNVNSYEWLKRNLHVPKNSRQMDKKEKLKNSKDKVEIPYFRGRGKRVSDHKSYARGRGKRAIRV